MAVYFTSGLVLFPILSSLESGSSLMPLPGFPVSILPTYMIFIGNHVLIQIIVCDSLFLTVFSLMVCPVSCTVVLFVSTGLVLLYILSSLKGGSSLMLLPGSPVSVSSFNSNN